MKKILYAVLITLLSGCTTPPTREQIANADYGTYPGNYKEIIQTYMSAILKDPDSAKYEYLNEPKTGWNQLFGQFKAGYVVCLNVNAKNSFGGYTGRQLYYLMIKDGRIIDDMHGSGGQFSSTTWERCRPFV